MIATEVINTTIDRSVHTVLVVDDNPATRYSTSRVIRAAGFTAESWKTAVGETFRGLAALEPQSEIDAIRAKLDAGASGLVALNAAQKAEALQALRAEFARMLAFRTEGARFADIVRPLAPRLKAILDNSSD